MSAHVPPRPASAASQQTIQVRVNGERRELPAGLSLAELLEVLGVPAAGTAVELGGTIVPPARHPETRLADGQVVEIVRFVGGG